MKVFWLKVVLCATICSLLINTAAYAQEDIPDRSQKSIKKESSKDKKRKKRKSGFFYGNAGSGFRWNKGESEVRLGGFIQADTRTYFEDSADFGKDNFLLRRIQPSLEVKFNKTYSFYIMSAFTSTPGILDVYLEGNFTKPFNVRVGKFKPPFGLERLQSATALAFNERAFPTNLAPNREGGAQIFGDLLWDTTEYQIGLYSGAIDNSSGLRGNVIYANHSGIDFVARIFCRGATGGRRVRGAASRRHAGQPRHRRRARRDGDRRGIELPEGAELFVFDTQESLVVSTVGMERPEREKVTGLQLDHRSTLITDLLNSVWETIAGLLAPQNTQNPVFGGEDLARDLVPAALAGETQIRTGRDVAGDAIFTVATPIRHEDRVIGVAAITSVAGEIDQLVRVEREQVLQMFVIAIVVSGG